jgi:hypothetical protein
MTLRALTPDEEAAIMQRFNDSPRPINALYPGMILRLREELANPALSPEVRASKEKELASALA